MRLGSLSGLLIADVRITHGSSDILWRRISCISRKSFPIWLSRIVAAPWRSPWAVIFPTPSE